MMGDGEITCVDLLLDGVPHSVNDGPILGA
jgi:hypothetical protein